MNRHFERAPHRHGASSEGSAPNAALLIDFDNVTMAMRSNLALELRSLLNSEIIRGKVAVQRAYADWRRYPQYIVPLSESSIDLIFAPAYGSSKKNATDIRLAIDALELVFTRPEIGTYILLSGDSDFSSLVLKLKEYGKYVIGVGMQESSSDILVQNCDEYYSYSTLSGLTSAADMKTERSDPWELAERALARMVSRSDVMRSDRLKQVMLELDPGFDEKSIGYSKFNRFLAEAASREIVRLRKAPNGQYEVAPVRDRRPTTAEAPDRPRVSRGRRPEAQQGRRGRREPRAEAPAASVAPAPRTGPARPAGEAAVAVDEGGDRGGGPPPPPATALRRAYQLLAGAVRSLARDRQPVRDSEVKRKMLADDERFDETALGFRKFSRFLQQAHDEGVVDVTQGQDGNYYISPTDGGASPRSEARRAEPVGAPPGGEPSVASRSEGRGRSREGSVRGGRRPSRGAGGEEAAGRREPGRGRRGGQRREAEAALANGGRSGDEPEPVSAPPAEPAAPASSTEEAPSATPAPPAVTPGASRGSGEGSASRRGRGLGRFRRGSRGTAREGEGGRTAAGIGPLPLPGEEEEAVPTASPSPSPQAVRTTPAAEGRGGLGRFRPGSRGRRPGGPPPGTPGGSTPSQEEAIEHMVQNYPGVGERTAVRLVEEFGEEVFQVIDREPERLSDVLPEGRARAVLRAREAELTSEGMDQQGDRGQ